MLTKILSPSKIKVDLSTSDTECTFKTFLRGHNDQGNLLMMHTMGWSNRELVFLTSQVAKNKADHEVYSSGNMMFCP